jgi:hypothetical protein
MLHNPLDVDSQQGKVAERLQHGLRPVSHSAVELKILAGFIGTLVLLSIGGGFTYLATDEFANSAQWVIHTQQVRGNLTRIHAAISDAESAQRDYLITGIPQLFMSSADDCPLSVLLAILCYCDI